MVDLKGVISRTWVGRLVEGVVEVGGGDWVVEVGRRARMVSGLRDWMGLLWWSRSTNLVIVVTSDEMNVRMSVRDE